MKEIELKVEGMHCKGCENRIKNALGTINEVKNVEANHENGKVKVFLKKEIDINQIKEKIENLDFKVAE